MLGADLAGMGMQHRLGMEIDKGDEIRPGPEDLTGAGDAFGNLLRVGLGPLHRRIAEVGDDNIDRGGVPIASALDEVEQFLVRFFIMGGGDDDQVLAGDRSRKGMIGLTVGKTPSDHLG